MTDLAERVAVVTGAGSGIGRGLALALGRERVSVVVADILAENAEKVAAEIKQAGGKAAGIACDVSDRASVRAMKTEANRVFGPVSLVLANAGVTMFERLIDMSDDEIDWIIQVNLMGVMNCLQIFLPDMMEARDGHIFATASVAGLLCSFIDNHAPYIATKSGIIGMMLSMRRELELYGIGSTVLCPDGVATNISESHRSKPARFGGPSDTHVTLPSSDKVADQTHWRPPAEVADMVLNAIRENHPVVVTDGRRKQAFQMGYADLVLSAYDRATEFDKGRR